MAATQVEDCPNAVSAEARAAALAVELLLQAAIPGPRVTIAGDCRPVVNYAAGLRKADQHHLLDSALTRLVVHGWAVDWRILPRSLNGEARSLAADGRAGKPCRPVGPTFR
eukprot:6082490-Alexandrium_andersonii.AAC.1